MLGYKFVSMIDQRQNHCPMKNLSSETTAESSGVSETLIRPFRASSTVPKIRKVNEYIIFYDEVLGEGEFGIVVKAQRASDLDANQDSNAGKQIVAPTVDQSKQVFACKICNLENFSDKDL